MGTLKLKDIPGWEGLYKASNYGSIFSMRMGKFLISTLNQQTGYLQVRLSGKGKRVSYPVHRLIALTFFGPLSKGQWTMHGPCGKMVNSVNNLTYGTPLQNMQDWKDGGKTWNTLKDVHDSYLTGENQMDDKDDLVLPGGFPEEDFDDNEFFSEEEDWEGDDWEEED